MGINLNYENPIQILIEMCLFRRYFFSWRDPALKGIEEDWLGARNYCRKRCMDSVSLETSNENEWIKRRLVDEKVFFASIIFIRKFHRIFSHLRPVHITIKTKNAQQLKIAREEKREKAKKKQRENAARYAREDSMTTCKRR